MQEVQDLVTPTATRLKPNPVSQDAGDHRNAKHGENAQLSAGREGPGAHQNQRARYGDSHLVRKNPSEQ
jgi:hypothetical protein